MITEALTKVVDGQNLDQIAAAKLMDAILEEKMTPAQFGAFVTALRLKGETPEELAGLAASMGRHALRVQIQSDNLLDTCGTGGGKTRWLGISTSAALVAAGAGAVVAKHGNRGVTRPAGSSDLLESLGVNLRAGPEHVRQALKEARVGFMFAQTFHPAMKFAAPLRREIGIRTVFNILGPLTNPAGASRRLLGVGDASLLSTLAETLVLLKIDRAFVVHGHNGVDEVSLTGPTYVAEVNGAEYSTYTLEPDDFDLPVVDASDLDIEDAKYAADVTRSVLAGTNTSPRLNVILANASTALVAAGVATDLRDGVAKARASIESGAALSCLTKLIEISNRDLDLRS
jgi:anthranilate phosphoribosyltransferase